MQQELNSASKAVAKKESNTQDDQSHFDYFGQNFPLKHPLPEDPSCSDFDMIFNSSLVLSQRSNTEEDIFSAMILRKKPKRTFKQHKVMCRNTLRILKKNYERLRDKMPPEQYKQFENKFSIFLKSSDKISRASLKHLNVLLDSSESRQYSAYMRRALAQIIREYCIGKLRFEGMNCSKKSGYLCLYKILALRCRNRHLVTRNEIP